MLPTDHRLPDLTRYIEQQSYFVLHAPRQVGKTTTLTHLGQQLTAQGTYASVVVSMEVGAAFPDNVGAAEDAILGSWRRTAAGKLPTEVQPPPWPTANPGERIAAALFAWCRAIPRPLVIFLDEIDALRDHVLLSVLRQLRDGYGNRPEGFPWSLGLVGLRDVRDYKIASGGGSYLQTSSPVNIKAESLTLGNFTRSEVDELYAQHTQATGQHFDPAALERTFSWTQGQPWLVNALARQLTEKLVTDPSVSITAADVDRAKDILIQRQDTHLDSLAERLREPRVRALMEPMLAGTSPGEIPGDDIRFVLDLGLVRWGIGGNLEPANPIYKEVLVRSLSESPRAAMPALAPTWLRPDGTLDPAKLLEAFLGFWRQHGEPLLKSAPYHEIAPHLVLMAFLHRVVNDGGNLDREYAIGSGRMDLLLTYGDQKVAMELKVWRKADPLKEGLTQLDLYLAGLDLATGWLVIFDVRGRRRPAAERTGGFVSRHARWPDGDGGACMTPREEQHEERKENHDPLHG